jgi:DNA-binding response OmpR family regulator
MADPMRVLLIEDNPDAATLVRTVVRQDHGSPVEIEWSEDLEGGRARLQALQFGAVLLDLNLPDSAGFDTFARVRTAAPNSAVIVLTGEDDESLALRAVRGGVEEYLLKRDITAVPLVRRIRYAVERNRAGRQRENGLGSERKLISSPRISIRLYIGCLRDSACSVVLRLTRAILRRPQGRWPKRAGAKPTMCSWIGPAC